jgi:pentatricopeptide repeat protein
MQLCEACGAVATAGRGACGGRARSGVATTSGSRCSTTCSAVGARPTWSPTTSSSRRHAVREATERPWSWPTSLMLYAEEIWMAPESSWIAVLPEGAKSNTVNYKSVLNVFCGVEQWDDADEIVTEMIQENCQ